MRRWLRRTIPSMFHRRLLLLGALSTVLMLGLGLQTARLTTGTNHDTRRVDAERALRTTSYIPTVRGRILDRTGTAVLAVDEPGWDVHIQYSVLTQEWVLDQAEAAARIELGAAAWKELDAYERDEAIGDRLEPYQEQVDEMWQLLADLTGRSRDELDDVREGIVGRTERIAVEVSQRHRRKRMAELQEELSAPEAYTEIREQFQKHPVLFDVKPEAVEMLAKLASDAREQAREWRTETSRGYRLTAPPPGNAIWLEVEPVRARHRRYPLETVTLTLDRSTFPGPLRSDTPIELTVSGVAMHILGQLRPVYAEDDAWDAHPFIDFAEGGERIEHLDGYQAGDRIGAFGVERTLERTLRGSRGKTVRRLDSDAVVEDTPPRSGRDVVLSIDHKLQARVQALMSHDERLGLMRVQPWVESPLPVGMPLHGSAVAMDLETGEVLAAVSVPGITLDQLENDRGSIFEDFTHEPFTFRPTAFARAPGSTAKPLILAAAITEGVLDPNETLDEDALIRGHLYKNRPDMFQDWIRRQYGQTFGPLDAAAAIKVSSNVYFGLMGQRLGAPRVHGTFEAFGAGRKLGIEIEERPGNLFDPNDANAQSEANFACIGQGQLTMTPLQVLAAHAALFRDGQYLAPTFLHGKPRKPVDLGLSPAALAAVKEGMWKSANEPALGDAVSGTTYQLNLGEFGNSERYFTVPGVTVYAKSGSAQTYPTVEKFDDDGDGLVDREGDVVRHGAHGWAVAMVQPDGADRPTLGVVVCVEHGWSGGKSAAPLVNQIIRACQIEGYLPSPGPAGSIASGAAF